MGTKNETRVQKFFKGNLGAKEVFQTSDGFLFNKKQDAKAYAKTLKNQTVAVFTNKVNTTKAAEAKKAEEAKNEAEIKKAEEAKKVAETTKATEAKKAAEIKKADEAKNSEKVNKAEEAKSVDQQ